MAARLIRSTIDRGRSAVLASAVIVTTVLGGGCAVRPYQPLEVDLGRGIDDETFAAAARVVAAEYPSVTIESDERRMQSDWENCVDDFRPARRRVVLFQSDDDTLALVVQCQRLDMGWFGPPRWSTPVPHARFERALAARLAAALDVDGA